MPCCVGEPGRKAQHSTLHYHSVMRIGAVVWRCVSVQCVAQLLGGLYALVALRTKWEGGRRATTPRCNALRRVLGVEW